MSGLLTGLSLLFSSCRSGQDQGMDDYFNREIRNRMQIIAGLRENSDSLTLVAAALDEEINKIILLSKDVENPGASVNRANDCFKTLALRHAINGSDFAKVSTAMPVKDFAMAVRQNELNFLNQLILKSDPAGLPLFTAQ